MFTVVASFQSGALAGALRTEDTNGPNPTRGRFALTAPLVSGASASLSVFDVSGRRVAIVRGPSGSELVWEGKTQDGTPVGPGIYLYRLEVAKLRQEGKIVVVR